MNQELYEQALANAKKIIKAHGKPEAVLWTANGIDVHFYYGIGDTKFVGEFWGEPDYIYGKHIVNAEVDKLCNALKLSAGACEHDVFYDLLRAERESAAECQRPRWDEEIGGIKASFYLEDTSYGKCEEIFSWIDDKLNSSSNPIMASMFAEYDDEFGGTSISTDYTCQKDDLLFFQTFEKELKAFLMQAIAAYPRVKIRGGFEHTNGDYKIAVQAEPLLETNYSRVELVGTQYENRNLAHEHMRIGNIVKLKRCPNNRHDANAIMAVNKKNQNLGHISAYWAKELANVLDRGLVEKMSAVVIECDAFRKDGKLRSAPQMRIAITVSLKNDLLEDCIVFKKEPKL